MNKYLTNYQLTGICTVDVDLVCKDWSNNFAVASWVNDKEERYTLIFKKLKVQISKEQAIEIIKRLRLIHVKSPMFNSASCYHSRSFVRSEITRMNRIKKTNLKELNKINKRFAELNSQLVVVDQTIDLYSSSIKK